MLVLGCDVDDEVVDTVGDQLGDLVAQLGGRVDVDLAADGDDRCTLDLTGRKCQIHVHSPGFRPNFRRRARSHSRPLH